MGSTLSHSVSFLGSTQLAPKVYKIHEFPALPNVGKPPVQGCSALPKNNFRMDYCENSDFLVVLPSTQKGLIEIQSQLK
jgi:hypothetical protein